MTTGGDIVWEFTSPFYDALGRHGSTNLVFKAVRYGHDYPGLAGRDLTPLRFDWPVGREVSTIGEPFP